MDALVSGLGYEAAQKALRSMGSFIDGHFSAVGGFSARLGLDEFVTVLPYSDMKEAEAILKGFADDFQERGSRDILSGKLEEVAAEMSFEFMVFAGIAEGRPIEGIDDIIEFAKKEQKEICRLHCRATGVG